MKFATFATYRPIPETVERLRPLHRQYLADLQSDGTLVLAGPFTDGSGALFVHEVGTAEEVARILAADPFAPEVFESLETRPWKPVFVTPASFRL